MASVYSMRVDCVAFEPYDEWDDDRGEHVEYGCVHFLPADGAGNGDDFLSLSRERVSDRRGYRYVGPVKTSVDWAEAEGGIVRAELGRGSLRLALDADAAASIEDDEVRVEFEVDDAEFARLRTELAALLGEEVVLRVDGGPDVTP